MPNWVRCVLTITGDSESLEDFKQKAMGENGVLDMDKFLQYPLVYKRQDDKWAEWQETHTTVENGVQRFTETPPGDLVGGGFCRGGRDWCCENWGSKWNFCDPETMSSENNELMYSFSSPWDIPKNILMLMSACFPTLGFFVSGTETTSMTEISTIFRNGKIVKHVEINCYPNELNPEIGENK